MKRSFAAEVLALDPLAYWRLGESSGTTAVDASGNGHDGTYEGSPTLGVDGLIVGDPDTAVEFDGSDDQVVVDDSDRTFEFAGRLPFTVVARVRPEAGLDDFARIVDRSESGGTPNGWRVYYTNNNGQEMITFSRSDGGSPDIIRSSATKVPLGTTATVAAVYDGDDMILYLDGVEVDRLASTLEIQAEDRDLGIGDLTTANDPWLGLIDEPSIFDYALSDSQIRALHDAAVGPGPSLDIQIAPGVQPLSVVSSTEWKSVVTDARRPLTIRRGRSRSLDQPTAGSMSVDLDNRAGDYDPDNSTGPHFGDLIPDVPTRVSAFQSSATYRLFRGSVDGWPQRWSEGGDFDAFVPLSAHDHFKMLSLPTIGPSYNSIVTDTTGLVGYWMLDESSGQSTAVDSSPTGVDLTIFNNTSAVNRVEGPHLGGGRTALQFIDITTSTGDGAAKSADPTTAYENLQTMTFACWFKIPTSSTQGGVLFQLHNDFTATIGNLQVEHLGHLSSTNRGEIQVKHHYSTLTQDADDVVRSGVAIDDNEWHHAAVRVDPTNTNLDLVVDGVTRDSTNLTSPMPGNTFPVVVGAREVGSRVFHLGAMSHVGLWDRVLTDGQVFRLFRQGAILDSFSTERSDQRIGRVLDFAGLSTSTAARDLRQGQTNLSADDADNSAALDYIRRVAQSENGAFFVAGDGKATFHDRHFRLTQQTTPQAVFGDLSSELPYSDLEFGLDDEDIANTVTVSRDGGSTATVFSTGSIDNHGRRLLERSNLLMADDNEAQSAAEWLLTRFADPNTRVRSITLKPHGSTELWPEVLGREIGDHIVVKRRPPGGNSTISKSVHVESIEHRISEKTWITRVVCSPVEGVDYLILNSTETPLGTGRLGY